MKIFGFEIRPRGSDKPPATPQHVHQRVALGRTRQRRSFQAGVTDRLTSTWTTRDETVNQSLLRYLRPMRARSRDFARNNEYGRKFFSLVRTNVVGHAGFSLKVDCRRPDGTPDKADSATVKGAYKRWCKKGQFEVTGKLSEVMFDTLAINMIARDGEVLIRLVEGRDRGIHRFQLQILPGHLLDEEHNRDLDNGHRIRMGVEFDAWMKPVAYHLRLDAPRSDIDGSTAQRYERVPASEMLHLFVPEEINQWRGTPWAYVGLRDARHLDTFDEAALVAANVGAAKMGFFQQKEGAEGSPIGGEEVGDGSGDFITEASPGTFDIIPEGYELKEYDPTYPNEVYDPFTKNVARRLSTGLLTSYHALTGDLTSVSFSSIRSGTLDEREVWKMLQGWYITDAKEVVFEHWLSRAMLYDVELRRLPYSKFEKFNVPVYGGRRWDWVDPKSDMAAEREAVDLGIKSRAQVIRERGRDPEEVWDELDAEKARGFGPKQQKPSNATANEDDEDEDEEDAAEAA